jgi:hypothetical protein
MTKKKPTRYSAIIGTLFKRHCWPGMTRFEFSREEFVDAAKSLQIALPENLDDTIYSLPFRIALPRDIAATASKGVEWGIEPAGEDWFRFRLGTLIRIVPRPDRIAIKIPDATPEIVASHGLSDEQKLLAKVRYNRLVDIFLGIATFPLRNHLRTTASDVGQIDVDEIYAGVNRYGQQFVIPVQAKCATDQLGVTQTRQDMPATRRSFRALLAGWFQQNSSPAVLSHCSN